MQIAALSPHAYSVDEWTRAAAFTQPPCHTSPPGQTRTDGRIPAAVSAQHQAAYPIEPGRETSRELSVRQDSLWPWWAWVKFLQERVCNYFIPVTLIALSISNLALLFLFCRCVLNPLCYRESKGSEGVTQLPPRSALACGCPVVVMGRGKVS